MNMIYLCNKTKLMVAETCGNPLFALSASTKETIVSLLLINCNLQALGWSLNAGFIHTIIIT
jgi:hypothetical protein